MVIYGWHSRSGKARKDRGWLQRKVLRALLAAKGDGTLSTHDLIVACFPWPRSSASGRPRDNLRRAVQRA
jgi:hypothetical protein